MVEPTRYGAPYADCSQYVFAGTCPGSVPLTAPSNVMARNRVSLGSWKSRKAPVLDVMGASETLMRAGTGIDEAEGATDGEDVPSDGVGAGADVGPEANGTHATTEAMRTVIRICGASVRTQSR
jgi:hypothetical protein